MKQRTKLLICLYVGVLMTANTNYSQDKLAIWTEFVSSLKNKNITIERIKPYEKLSPDVIFGFLELIQEKASWKEFETTPEVHEVDQHVHYLIPLTFDNHKTTYCFTFLKEDKKWYFRHLEAIFIRLDRLSSIPTSEFPDVDEEMKDYMREEIFWSREIHLFNRIAKEKGEEIAYNYFIDGAGYFIAAKTFLEQ